MQPAARKRRLVSAGTYITAGHSLQDAARVYRMSPSGLLRALRHGLPEADPDLWAKVERRLEEIRADRPRVAAAARWSRSRQPWAVQLREEVRVYIQCRLRGDSTAPVAARIRHLLEDSSGDMEA